MTLTDFKSEHQNRKFKEFRFKTLKPVEKKTNFVKNKLNSYQS